MQFLVYWQRETLMPMALLQTVLVEDEPNAVLLLTSIFREFCADVEVVATAPSVEEAIMAIEKHQPDLVFFDIEIQGGTSFDVLQQTDYNEFYTIFTTAFDQHALKAFKYKAIDYLLKPYSPTAVVSAIERISEMHSDREIGKLFGKEVIRQTLEEKIAVQGVKGILFVNVGEVVYIESDKSYAYLHLQDGQRIFASKSLKDFEGILPDGIFYRSHASFIINCNHILRYIKNDGGQIQLTNDVKVPLARRRKADFMEFLSNQFLLTK